ncbi:MAG: hypothetical protein DHS20C18_49960 [Saprospiraceae bacterium]|nr:MAG: hypothetical protein DHS20C18_49960 [Saprospiraceae bacterium]
MKNHFLYILALSFIFTIGLQAQEATTFPDSWCGNWAGELEIYSGIGLLQKVPMSLTIQPTDSVDVYTWTLVYGSGEKSSIRPYELKVIDRENGQYVIDEKNSIFLQAYLLGGKFYNRFAVGENLLMTTTELLGEQLIFEVVFGKREPISTTGGQQYNGEDIPEVYSFEVLGRQRAVLERG